MDSIRVLLVDDETIVRKSLKQLLPWETYAMRVVGEASNGEEALDWLEENQADVAFVDLSMPVMDGFELCQQLSRSRPEMLKIILTCHAELPMIQRAIEGNISGYIIKSDFDMEKIAKLFARIQQNVLRSRSQKAHDLLILGGAAADIHSMQGQGAAMIRLAERVILARTTIPTTEWIQGIPDSIIVSLTGEQARQAQADQRALEEVLQRYAAYEMTPGMRLYTFAPRPTLD